MLFACGFAGAVTYGSPTPRAARVRKVAALLAVLAVLTIVVIAIAGPGEWCGEGSAYEVPGCA